MCKSASFQNPTGCTQRLVITNVADLVPPHGPGLVNAKAATPLAALDFAA